MKANIPVFDIAEMDDGEGEYNEDETWAGNQPNGESEPASSKDAPGVLEGWTVVEDGGDSDMAPEYCNDSQDNSIRNASASFPNFQSTSANGCGQNKTSATRAPLLEGLLRDFQFQPNNFVSETSHEPPIARGTFCVPPPDTTQIPDDPRELIERLLNVVAPDVARFLLEEAIQARARPRPVATNGQVPTLSSIPVIERVTGSVSVVGPVRRIGMPTMVAKPMPMDTLSDLVEKTAPDLLAASRAKSYHRLGKLGTFKCPECPTLFKRRRYLERHVRARHRLHCYRCTMPNCAFTNARELWYVRRHHAKHHADDALLICRFCSKQFPNSDEMTSRHHTCCSMAPKKPTDSTAGTSTQGNTTDGIMSGEKMS